MKNYFLLVFGIGIFIFSGCEKNDVQSSNSNVNQTQVSLQKGGSGGGGGGTQTGLLQNVVAGLAARMKGGTNDSLFVSFSQPAVAGWILQISSNNAAVTVPSTFAVPVAAFSVSIPITANNVTIGTNVIVTVQLQTSSKSTTTKVYPVNATFPAPQLQSPGSGSKFGLQLQVTFDWNDNNDAYYYEFQVSKSSTFSTLLFDLLLNNSIYPTNWFDGTGIRYWRIRFVDAGGNGGPWSAVRSFEIKPQ